MSAPARPPGWIAADKTGSGSYGTTNDIAVIWPVSGKPIVMAVFFTQKERASPARREVLASIARLVSRTLRVE